MLQKLKGEYVYNITIKQVCDPKGKSKGALFFLFTIHIAVLADLVE